MKVQPRKQAEMKKQFIKNQEGEDKALEILKVKNMALRFLKIAMQ